MQFRTTEGASFEQRVNALGGKILRRENQIGAALVTGLSPAAAVALSTQGDVEDVSSDLEAQLIAPRSQLIRSVVRMTGPRAKATSKIDQTGAFFFNDFQWNMRVIRAPEGWAQTPAGRHTLVCMLDTGIDPTHIDLAGKVDLDLSTSFVQTEPFIEDLNFHGTYTATLVSSNGLGIASVAPAARLCAIKVIGATGSGSFADAIAGIVYAGIIKADVINMSFGALFDLSDKDQRGLAKALQKAVDFAHKQGVTIVAASGNDALNLDKTGKIKSLPAQLEMLLISVGATGPLNQQHFFGLVASYLNFGRSGNDVVAPGGEEHRGRDPRPVRSPGPDRVPRAASLFPVAREGTSLRVGRWHQCVCPARHGRRRGGRIELQGQPAARQDRGVHRAGGRRYWSRGLLWCRSHRHPGRGSL